jgi:competence protein ComEA
MTDRIPAHTWLIAAVLAIPLVAGSAYLLSDLSGDDAERLEINPTAPKMSEASVYVTGAVVSPGVYPAAEGDRWIDAVEAAGGPAADADLQAVNLARRVADEDMIVVPHVGEAVAEEPGAGTPAGTSVVNINTASQAELEELPGIGEVRAGRILASRESDGPFQAVEDLLARELVPDGVFQDIVPLISVN